MTGTDDRAFRHNAGESLAASPCDLWFVDLADGAGALEHEERLHPRLSPDEVQRAEVIKDSGVRRHWRAAHIALRFCLERFAGDAWRGVPFTIAPGGRPALPEGAPHFSLSHSDGWALIALSGHGPIGVDLERVRPRKISGARRLGVEAYALALAEGAPLPVSSDARFVQAWCRIEALAKADGRGIGKVLTEAGLIGRVEGHCGAPSTASQVFRVSDIALGESNSSGFVAAMALPHSLANTSGWPPGVHFDLRNLLGAVSG
ncbi:MAG: phosphopantetheinyl transferase [Hyphomicrobium sp.]